MSSMMENVELCQKDFEKNKDYLSTLQPRKDELERSIRNVENKIWQLSENGRKSEDSVKWCKLKLRRTENLVQAGENNMLLMSKCIQKISDEIKFEEDAIVRDMEQFEYEVDKLVAYLRNIGMFYSYDNLADEEAKIRKKLEEISFLKNGGKEIKKCALYEEFTGKRWEMILNIFQTEAQLCKEQLEVVKFKYSN